MSTKYKSTKKSKNRKNRQIQKGKIIFILIVLMVLGGLGMYFKNRLHFYYASRFAESHELLSNNAFEEERINRIIGQYADMTFGVDISHYQPHEKINWENFTIGNGSIPIEFIILRATMGTNGKDKHFEEFWKSAKNAGLIRGAYHFYRPYENPEKQANWFLENIQLEKGDLPPILDIEKYPIGTNPDHFRQDLKIFLNILEEAYGEKPILYSYFNFYKDFLRGPFDEYPLWMANYNEVLSPSEEDNWLFWQFTEKGVVSNINTKVDLNIFNGQTWQLRSYTLD